MIVTTPILKGLKKIKPDLFIGILANQNNIEIIKNDPNVNKIHMIPSNWWEFWTEIRNIRRERYDLVFNFVFIKMTLNGILVNMIAPKSIKVGQGEQRYKFYYNKLLSIQRHSEPMVNVLMTFVREAVGVEIEPLNYDYEINIDETTRSNVLSFLKNNHLTQRSVHNPKELPYIVFNLSVNDTARQFSIEQAFALGKYLDSRTDFRTILLHMSSDNVMNSTKKLLVEGTKCIAFPENRDASLLEIAFLIGGALAVITPDTSIVHFASAAKTPVLGFYATLLHEWLPYKVMNSIIVADKNCPVSSIPVPLMIESVQKFLINLPILI
jgi:ADP-heptose:LPS heptosyltransferase